MASRSSFTWKHIRRSPYQSLAAVAVLSITFFVASIFSLVTLGSQQVLRYFETRPQVTAFFKDNTDLSTINNLKQQLETQEFVDSVKYVSKEEALSIYREQNKNDPLLLEMVTADILPASLEVSGISAEVLPQIADILSGDPVIEEVVYQKDVIETLRSWARAIRLAGLALVAVLVATSILTIGVLIGISIANHRREIEVLHLFGANQWYIKKPFILEGALYGVIGAFIAWGLNYVLLLYATPFLVSFLGTIPLLPVPVTFMLAFLAALILLGASIGSIGSFLAVRRFLR